MSLAKYDEDNWCLIEERLFMKGGMCETLLLSETKGGIKQIGKPESFNQFEKEMVVRI